MTSELSGVLTALVTPFAGDGAVDEQRLRQLVDRNVAAGVDGVVACGSTGEFAALSLDERRRVVETVADQAGGRVPVVAQTGAMRTADAIALTRHAASCGVAAVMVVTPYYEPLTLRETRHYLRTVAGSADVPVMLYNLPVATGVNLDPDTIGALAREVGNIRYVKDTSADLAQAGRLIHHHGDVVSTFVGWDSLILAALTEGAAGVMAGTANVLGAQLVAVRRAVLAGDHDAATTQWRRVYPLLDAIMSEPFVPAVRCALAAAGFPVGSPREPVLDLETGAAERIGALAAGLLADDRTATTG